MMSMYAAAQKLDCFIFADLWPLGNEIRVCFLCSAAFVIELSGFF